MQSHFFYACRCVIWGLIPHKFGYRSTQSTIDYDNCFCKILVFNNLIKTQNLVLLFHYL